MDPFSALYHAFMVATDAEVRIARAVRYMEAHAGRAFSLDEAAAEACWSLFHFHRVFTALMGLGPGEYLRRRRLANAAEALAFTGDTVRQIAVRHGFGTAESFGRAFREAFGVSPIVYRRTSASTRRPNPFLSVERPTFLRPPSLEEDPEVVESGAIRLATLGFSCSLEAEELGPCIEAFWKGPAKRLRMLPGVHHETTFGLALPDEACPGKRIQCLAGVERPVGVPCPAWGRAFEIPAGRYLRSVSKGDLPDITGIWLYLYGHWLPRHGLEPGMAFDFDVVRSTIPRRVELFLPLKERKD